VKTKLISIFSIILISILLFPGSQNIPEAAGHGNVDQSFEGPFTGSLNPAGAFQPVSQGFVPDQSKLVAVDIFIHDFGGCCATGEFIVTIWEGAVGMGSPLGSQTEEIEADGVGPLTDPDILHFDFNPVITLNPGTSYVIQVDRGIPIISQLARGGDGYPDGIGIFAGSPIGGDWGFRTYFETEVVGGELLPIDNTVLLLAGAQTNAVWILSALAVIGSVAFGALYITSKKN